MIDTLADIVEHLTEKRAESGKEIEAHAILDFGEEQYAFVPIDAPLLALAPLEKVLYGAGVICRQRGALRLYVALEAMGLVCHSQAEAQAIQQKYPSPRDIPADDLDRFLLVSEICFGDLDRSRVARIKIPGHGSRLGPTRVVEDHVCMVFHPIVAGYKIGRMPPGFDFRVETAPPDL